MAPPPCWPYLRKSDAPLILFTNVRKGTAKDSKRPLRSKSYIILHQAKDELICIFDDATNVPSDEVRLPKMEAEEAFYASPFAV